MRGYWREPDESARKLRPGPSPGERVLYTGDLCRLDDDGYLYFVARTDDIIKSRGEKVAPKEVEMALQSIPGVHEAAVIGVADDVLGEAVEAFVVLEPGASRRRRISCAPVGRLEPYMVPKRHVVPSLPRRRTARSTRATSTVRPEVSKAAKANDARWHMRYDAPPMPPRRKSSRR